MIRALLVPAVMRLLGRWNWWLPKRAAKLLLVREQPSSRRQRYSAKTSQPRYISDSTASVTNAVACAASANVYGPGCTASCEPGGKDLGLDDARRAVVDGAQDRHRATVLLRVADEELAAGRLGCSGHGAPVVAGAAARRESRPPDGRRRERPVSPAIAFVAACATASRSAKPSSRSATSPGAR